MNCDFKRKLPIPMEVKERYPITAEMEKNRDARDIEIKKVLTYEKRDVNIIKDRAKRSAKKQNKKLLKKV